MPSANYPQLALSWQPSEKHDNGFYLIVVSVLAVLLSIAWFFSTVDLPEPERRALTPIPERIAEFIEQKPKPKPKPQPKPEPKPEPPKPKPKVERKPEKEPDKPLTETQKKAREKAEDTGLLALGNELADLFDTAEVDAMVGAKVSDASAAATQAAGHDKDLLTAGAGEGSGGVDAGKYAANIGGTTQLSERERIAVRQSLLQGDAADDKSTQRQRRSGANIRAEEDVTIVFDQNKGKLYSLYNRARRTNPNLKGKVVLEITIAPSGKVTNVRILSSELNDPKLEKSLLARIRNFNFGAKEVEPVTVKFPIEFLPS